MGTGIGRRGKTHACHLCGLRYRPTETLHMHTEAGVVTKPREVA